MVDTASVNFTYSDSLNQITADVLPAGVDHDSLLNVHQDVNTTASPTFVDLVLSGGDIYPTADSTTAIQINKANGTTNVLTVDTTNARVGIGETAPEGLLHLSGSVVEFYMESTGGGRKWRLLSNTDGALSIRDQTATRNILTLSSIDSKASFEWVDVVIQGTAATAGDTYNDSNKLKLWSSRWTGSAAANDEMYFQLIRNSAADNDQRLTIFNDASSPVVTILNNGKVGIGTTGPSDVLEVVSSLDYRTLRLTDTKTDTTAQRVGIVGQHYTSAEEPISLIHAYVDNNESFVSLGGGATSNAVEKIRFWTAADTTTTGGTERMVIDKAGFVGIGTVTPLARLHVLDTSINNIRLSSNETAATAKYSAIIGSQYDSAGETEGMLMMATQNTVSANQIMIGGGFGGRNTATIIDFFTASNLTTRTGTNRLHIHHDGNIGVNVSDPDAKLEILQGSTQLKLSFDATDNATFAVDTAGDLTITASGDEIKVADWVRHTSASYRRYYHLDLASFDPGASGATWIEAGANGIGGWQLNASVETLQSKVDTHADWDGASDPKLEIRFQINTASSENDTVDLKVVTYYMGTGDSSTKTQTVEVATNVGDGGIKAQYTMFVVEVPLNWDETDNNIVAGDCIAFQINLETDTSEVDDITLNAITFHYNTTHTGIEAGDT